MVIALIENGFEVSVRDLLGAIVKVYAFVFCEITSNDQFLH
jgi:hypothetical protein